MMLEINVQRVPLDRKEKGGIFHDLTGKSHDLPEFSWVDLPETGPDEVIFDLNAAVENDLPVGTVIYEKEVIIGRASGVEDILHELRENGYSNHLFPDFNYDLGAACRQMGLIDEAIEQLMVALETGQNPVESAHLLGLCYKEKGFTGEAQEFFRRSLEMKTSKPEKTEQAGKDSALVSAEKKAPVKEPFEQRAVDSISLADLELQKKIASLGGCLKLQQEYSA
jgi:tetratricopeptide (TPR) repeat protein